MYCNTSEKYGTFDRKHRVMGLGQSKMQATLDVCPRPARKETNVPLKVSRSRNKIVMQKLLPKKNA